MKVPQVAAKPKAEQIDPTMLMMAAAIMHQHGKFDQPEPKVDGTTTSK